MFGPSLCPGPATANYVRTGIYRVAEVTLKLTVAHITVYEELLSSRKEVSVQGGGSVVAEGESKEALPRAMLRVGRGCTTRCRAAAEQVSDEHPQDSYGGTPYVT